MHSLIILSRPDGSAKSVLTLITMDVLLPVIEVITSDHAAELRAGVVVVAAVAKKGYSELSMMTQKMMWKTIHLQPSREQVLQKSQTHPHRALA